MSDNIFHLQPWTPKLLETADDITNRIHGVTPELEVLFMGAAALGLPGKNDIDLDILCDVAEIKTNTQKLIQVLGQPKETKDDMTVWESEVNGFEVDAILSDPKASHVPLQRKRFEILKGNALLLDEYKNLKESSDGIPYAEYEKRKLDFLENRVYASKLISKSETNVSDADVKSLLMASDIQILHRPKSKRPTMLIFTAIVLIVLVVAASYILGALKHGSKVTSGTDQTTSTNSQTQSVTNQVNQDVKSCSDLVTAVSQC